MNLALLALGVVAVLAFGYLAYGRFLARQYQLDDRRATPASTINDGVDFIPTRPFYLLSQHFSAIAAAGPIVGPIVACMAFGWLPCLLWIIIGVTLIGAVHDFSALVASLRHGARSIADVARVHLGTKAYLSLVAFIWLALLYVIVAFTDVTAGTFQGKSEELAGLDGAVAFNIGGAVAAASVYYLLLSVIMGLTQRWLNPPMWLVTLIFVPATLGVIYLGTLTSTWTVFAAPEQLLGLQESARPKVWCSLILLYCFAASLLPMWVLQQPRGYLGGFILYLAIGVGVLGILFGGFSIQQPMMQPVADYEAFFGFASSSGAAPPMTALIFPFLFVTIACGACSGFHGLVCGGTTSRQVAKESHCTAIGFGAMLLEGFVAVIALTTVMILTRDQLAQYQGRPGAIYGDGIATFLSKLLGIQSDQGRAIARTFGQMAVATFVFDTLDVSTRLGRYLISELFSRRKEPRQHDHAHETGHSHTQVAAPVEQTSSRWLGVFGAALTTLVPLVILLVAAKGSYLLFWTLFGTSNQLLASLTLIGITVWLYRSGRRYWFVAIPAAIVLTITLTAIVIQIFVGVRDAMAGKFLITALQTAAGPASTGLNPTVLNAGIAIALLALAMLFIVQATRAMCSSTKPMT